MQIAAPGVVLTSDTGISDSDKITNDGTLILTGIESGAQFEFSIDGGTTWSSNFTAGEGNNTVQVRQTDVAGNTSSVGSLQFTLDATADAPVVALASDTGTSGSYLLSNDGTLALSGIEAGASVEYSIDGGATWSSNFTAGEGNNTVQVRQTDVAGNTSSVGSLTFTLEKRNLAELIGMSEISVLADIYGQFVNSIAENQMLEGESASQVDETNLLESISAGRTFSRESIAAQSRTEQAKAQTGQAFAFLLPSVSVRFSSGAEKSEPSVEIDETTGELKSSDTHTRTDLSLTATQPLFDLPSFMDWRRRKARELARREDYRVSDGDAYISTVNAYLSLISSRLQIDITRDFEAKLAELLSYIEKRADAGAASVSDMSRVRARSQETLSSRLEQESAHAAAGIEFVRLTNLIPQKVRLPVLQDVGASTLPQTFDMAVAASMRSNPEIAALTAELQAAKIDQSVAQSQFLPRVDAEFTETYSDGAGGSSTSQRDTRLMLVMNWELFSGGEKYHLHAERTARYKELRYRLDDQRRRIVQALSANYAALATTRERITSGYKELKSISTAMEAMAKRMLSGNQSLLDLLDVYDRYYRVRSRLVSLHILEMNISAQIIRLTLGTPEADSGGPPLTEESSAPVDDIDSLKEENSHGNAS